MTDVGLKLNAPKLRRMDNTFHSHLQPIVNQFDNQFVKHAKPQTDNKPPNYLDLCTLYTIILLLLQI